MILPCVLPHDDAHGDGVTQGAEDDEHMPDSMPEGMLLVAVEEICADGIEDSFRKNPPEGDVRHVLPHRPKDEQGGPSHGEIQGQGEPGIFA